MISVLFSAIWILISINLLFLLWLHCGRSYITRYDIDLGIALFDDLHCSLNMRNFVEELVE